MAGLFDKQANLYLDARPNYPNEWYSMLAALTPHHSYAWDVGTGNGQAALGVAEYYEKVIGTDVSEAQLKHAVPHPKVSYIHTPLSMSNDEQISMLGGEGSIDLITVAQAVHWFDLQNFYSLVNRLLRKPGGVIAVWGYNDITVDPSVDLILKRFHETTLPFWNHNIRYIFDGYRTLPFPFESVGVGSEMEPLSLDMHKKLSFEGLLGMLRSWSAVVTAKDQGVDLLSEAVVKELESAWGGSGLVREVTYKAFMLAGALIVQVNFFDCGGIAIYVSISHKIADASTMTTFINTWASTTRDEQAIPMESIVSPTFDSAILYPPREGMSSSFSGVIDEQFTRQAQVQAEKMVTRFVFDGSKISTLQARYGGSNDEKTTRVEALRALIWKTAMIVSNSAPKPSIANISVEMRRLDPPLPEQSFGNLATIVSAAPSITKSGEVDLVGPLRESIRKINSDSLKMLQGDEGFLKFQEFMKMAMETYGKLDVYTFTSWCRFPLYEADFSWGKPNWVTIDSQPFKNTSVLMDNKTGDRIEAWICLMEENMAIFERDQELLEFISFFRFQ